MVSSAWMEDDCLMCGQREIHLHSLDCDEQMLDSYCSLLISMASSYAIALNDEQARHCLEHLLYVEQINSYINLTSITSLDEGIILHILDSLLFMRSSAEIHLGDATFLDMGTGAGFPGVPFHIVTGYQGVLLDSVKKKVDAVQAIIDALHLQNIEVVHDRLERYAADERNQFDLVLARALASLPVLIEYASPFLEEGGYLIVSKGVPTDEELTAGDRSAQVCGLKRIELLHLALPEDKGQRTIITYRKICPSLVSLPRAMGMARKHPLG